MEHMGMLIPMILIFELFVSRFWSFLIYIAEKKTSSRQVFQATGGQSGANVGLGRILEDSVAVAEWWWKTWNQIPYGFVKISDLKPMES